MKKLTHCATCLFCVLHATFKQRQCNNPEALRYRQQVGEWTVCPDFAEGAKE